MSVYMRDLNLMIYGRSSSCSSLYASTSSLVRRVEGLDNLTLGSEKEKRKKKKKTFLYSLILYIFKCASIPSWIPVTLALQYSTRFSLTSDISDMQPVWKWCYRNQDFRKLSQVEVRWDFKFSTRADLIEGIQVRGENKFFFWGLWFSWWLLLEQKKQEKKNPPPLSYTTCCRLAYTSTSVKFPASVLMWSFPPNKKKEKKRRKKHHIHYEGTKEFLKVDWNCELWRVMDEVIR